MPQSGIDLAIQLQGFCPNSKILLFCFCGQWGSVASLEMARCNGPEFEKSKNRRTKRDDPDSSEYDDGYSRSAPKIAPRRPTTTTCGGGFAVEREFWQTETNQQRPIR